MGVVRRVVCLVSIALLAACSSAARGPREEGSSSSTLEIRTDDGIVAIRVEVADEQPERSLGLMDRESLPEDAGMVFLWEDPLRTGFWMKDTLIPLSIAFWNERGRILSILDMEPCAEGDRCPTYDPGVEFIGAVEVNRGFFEEAGVEIGNRVELLAAGA
jgi:uncharacterized protein